MDAVVEGKTLCDIFARNASTFGGNPALSWKEEGTWRTLTWREYREQVAQVALGLAALGVGKGDSVAIMTRNRPEHLIADLAALHRAATPVSIYNTLSSEQIAYVTGHCAAKVAIVEDRDFMARWLDARKDLPQLECIVLLEGAEDFGDDDRVLSWEELRQRGRTALAADRDEFESAWRSLTPSDPVTIVYTSGTTGDPKGVVITNRNALWTCASVDLWGSWREGFEYVSYLPFAHILERLAGHWVCMWKTASVHFCPEVLEVFEIVPEVRPYALVAVPRLWEKLEAGIATALKEEPNQRKRALALRAIETGKKAVRLEQQGRAVPMWLKLERALFDKLVYKKIRSKVGLDECRLPVSSAAPVSQEVLEFFFAIGIPIIEAYGLTETTAPALVNPPDRPRIGTVGPPLPGVEARLLDDGELLVRGGNIAPGYYKDPEGTKGAFDDDGWLHTGDIARISDDGFVTIVDRKRELIVTAGGKNVSPANLENLLVRHELVSHACVIGDRRPYISALIVLDAEKVPQWAKDNGVEFSDLEQFAKEPAVQDDIRRGVDEANDKVSRPEAVKRFKLVTNQWTPTSGELTPTLKLKRRIINERYVEEIESLYSREQKA